jgi:hypothetical protein
MAGCDRWRPGFDFSHGGGGILLRVLRHFSFDRLIDLDTQLVPEAKREQDNFRNCVGCNTFLIRGVELPGLLFG